MLKGIPLRFPKGICIEKPLPGCARGGRALGRGGPAPKPMNITARPARTAPILVRLWNAHNTGVMDSNTCWRVHARVDLAFAAPRSVDSLSDGGSSARARWQAQSFRSSAPDTRR